MRVIGYVRVSTEEQALSGLGIEAQKASILAACTARGWALSSWYIDDGYTAKYGSPRPAYEDARAELRAGRADVLMAMKLDRLVRSARGIGDLVAEAEHKKTTYRIVFLDLGGVDTGTAAGKMFVQMMAVFAEFERDLIAERTRAALQAKRARGETLGAKREITGAVERRIRLLADEGLSTRQIAGSLTESRIPTPRGGPWRHSTIADVLNREDIAAGVPNDAAAL